MPFGPRVRHGLARRWYENGALFSEARHIGVLTEAEELLASINAVLPPKPRAVGLRQQIQATAVEQLHGFFRRLKAANRVSDGICGYHCERCGDTPSCTPPIMVRRHGSLKMQVDQETLVL